MTLTISNTGEGISEENIKHIFERFYKVSTDVEQSKSFGLGLSIARSIAQSMGGEISCESEPNKYTAFTVTLPLEKKKNQGEVNQKRLSERKKDAKALAETKSQTDAKKVKSKHKRRALTSSESENNFIEKETRQIENDDELQK